MPVHADIARLISEWRCGSLNAEQALFEELYRELHRIAIHVLRAEPRGRSLGPTALVHEAYVRLTTVRKMSIEDRTHLLALAARVMRRILVDRARARKTDKRGGDPVALELSEELVRTDRDADQIIGVDQALDRLQQSAPRQCMLVELRYFAGYTIEESAQILGVSTRTARREWQVARARLKGAIDGTIGSG
jgi:RNA polymerase sigma-70 factor (ECF subfamily)